MAPDCRTRRQSSRTVPGGPLRVTLRTNFLPGIGPSGCNFLLRECKMLLKCFFGIKTLTTNAKIKVGSRGWLVLYPSPLFPSRAAFWPLLAGFEARQPLLNPWQGQGRKKKPTTETTSRTTAPTSRGPRRWGGNPATPTASSGHPPTRKTDFLLALTFSARHAALLVVLAVQLALVVVVGAAHATAPVVGLWWVPGLVSRLDGQHKALGEAHLLCRGRQARAGEPPRGSVSRPARSTRS